MNRVKNLSISLIFFFLICDYPVNAQFIDNFDGPATPVENGWAYATGDGNATMEIVQGDGYASVRVDATRDRRNIWWALIRKQVPGLDLKKLMKPEYELRVEARIRISHAPRRVNLHFNHQRTTDFHSHLMEYDIPDTVNWHTISMTTKDFEVQIGDQINAQMALMDWGTAKYRVDIDYFKVDVVNRNKTGKDLGAQLPYHPPVPDPSAFHNHLSVIHDVTIDREFADMNFNNWQVSEDGLTTTLLNVNGTQMVILRWDFSEFRGNKINRSGLLELTTHSLQRSPDYQKDFGMVRVVEILGGDPDWRQENVTFNSFCAGHPLEEVINTQMVIDYEVNDKKGGNSLFTISYPVLQRMIDGKTWGLAIRPLGAVNASFYAMDNLEEKLSPKLHFDLESE